jgi:hypothetical protein
MDGIGQPANVETVDLPTLATDEEPRAADPGEVLLIGKVEDSQTLAEVERRDRLRVAHDPRRLAYFQRVRIASRSKSRTPSRKPARPITVKIAARSR